MNRNEAMFALNSVKKTVIAPTEESHRPSSAGMVGQVGNAFSRVRDRQLLAQEAPVAPQERAETWEERKARLRAEGERQRAEQRDLEQRRKWKDENDARVRKELQDRQQRVTEQNLIRAEVRQLLADEEPDVINEVIHRVKAAKMEHFVPAWVTFLDEVKTERSAASTA